MTSRPTSHPALPAKITPPEPGRFFSRPDLFRRLEDLCSSQRKIWISSPGGAGKTTLIRAYLASDRRPLLWYQVDQSDEDPANVFFYLSQLVEATGSGKKTLPLLTPEFLPSLGVFCRNFFRSLFVNFEHGCVLVFDDCQEGPGESLFGPLFAAAMAELPQDSALFIVSREEPYPVFARERMNHALSHLGWVDLQLSPEECREFVAWSKPGEFSTRSLDRVYALTQGWVAGLMLFQESRKTDLPSPGAFSYDQTELLFNYFAGEIFARLPEETRAFLLTCGFLPSVSVSMAEALTGRAEARTILRTLVRENHFTFRISAVPEIYRLHPLFRHFLVIRAEQELGPERVAQAKAEAARLLAVDGQVEPAAELLVKVGSWTGLIELIRTHAESLLQQGRSRTLLQWLDAIPESLRREDPWLCYWCGCCRLAEDPSRARKDLELAFELFDRRNDATGSMLAWAMIVYAIVVGWSDCARLDIWIERFDRLSARYPAYPLPEIEARMVQGIFKALTWRQPARADLPHWAERLNQIVEASRESNFRLLAGSDLVFYHTIAGNLPMAGALIELLQADLGRENVTPLNQLIWLAIRAVYAWITLDRQGCLETIETGRAIIEESGLHALDLRLYGQGITLGLTTGDLALVKQFLEKLSSVPSRDSLDQSFCCHLLADLSLFEGDPAKAVALAEMAVRAAETAGTPIPLSFSLGGLALALYRSGQKERAAEVVKKGLEASQGLDFLGCNCRLLAAHMALDAGDREGALAWLREGFNIAAREGYLNFHPWRDDIMTLLCREALSAGIEVDYVRRLVRCRGLAPDSRSPSPLTAKEVEILTWIKQGKNTWEISTILGISERTVKFHVGNLLRKLEATSRSHAVAIAIKQGLIAVD